MIKIKFRKYIFTIVRHHPPFFPSPPLPSPTLNPPVRAMSFKAMSFPSTAHTRAFTDAYRQSTVVAIATSPNITLVPPTDGRRARKGLGVKVRTPEVTEQGVECVVTAYTLMH